ncbi:MAG: type II toxin-antitoxin system RelE/ParE family toxin [Proteobacteria bacterium]|nr:type II toxin-antitoxin system RelE/ParE family toxin [Pseudomonadota bacterium]
MRAFKIKAFAKWASGEGLSDDALASAVVEMEKGLIDAKLGGQVVKKRVALPGRGKRGSTRTLVAFRQGNKAFFIYGFAKKERTNINEKELRALKMLAKELMSYTTATLTKATKAGELIEIEVNDNG